MQEVGACCHQQPRCLPRRSDGGWLGVRGTPQTQVDSWAWEKQAGQWPWPEMESSMYRRSRVRVLPTCGSAPDPGGIWYSAFILRVGPHSLMWAAANLSMSSVLQPSSKGFREGQSAVGSVGSVGRDGGSSSSNQGDREYQHLITVFICLVADNA